LPIMTPQRDRGNSAMATVRKSRLFLDVWLSRTSC
jgi:hypothetical protein